MYRITPLIIIIFIIINYYYTIITIIIVTILIIMYAKELDLIHFLEMKMKYRIKVAEVISLLPEKGCKYFTGSDSI